MNKPVRLKDVLGREVEKMKRPALLVLVLVTLPSGSLLAADAATPIWEPTT
jgi:hypothetical protein